MPWRGDLAASRLAALWSWSIDADTIFPLWVAIGTQRIAAFYAADLGHLLEALGSILVPWP